MEAWLLMLGLIDILVVIVLALAYFLWPKVQDAGRAAKTAYLTATGTTPQAQSGGLSHIEALDRHLVSRDVPLDKRLELVGPVLSYALQPDQKSAAPAPVCAYREATRE